MKALKDALADAKAILADPKNAKQADVDNALKTLTKAKEGLVPVTSDSKGTEAAKQEAKAPVTGDHSFAGITLLASMLCLSHLSTPSKRHPHLPGLHCLCLQEYFLPLQVRL